jgi:hypothetical protein
MSTRNRRQFVRHFAFACLLLPLIGMSLLNCTHSQPVTGHQTLRAWHKTDPRSAHNFCPYKNEFEMFGCTEAEYGAMHLARVEVSRIGEGAANYKDASRTVVLDHKDDGAVLGRLLDYDSYGEPNLCDFEPAIRVMVDTPHGRYQFDVCFACDGVFVQSPRTPKGRKSGSFMLHMSPLLRRDMVQLAQRFFPADRTLKPVYQQQKQKR